MPSRRIEQQIESLKSLRAGGATEAAEIALRRALKDRVNVVVAKAASVTAELEILPLLPDLCAAFERMFRKPVETDPQCWAKNALSIALKHLGYAESEPFLKGLQHVQMEAVWGGQEDTATTLRGTCVLALVQTTDLPRRETLRYLVRGLTDSPNVRLDAVRALEQMDGDEAALLLRLKARMGDNQIAVTGQVFDSLLRLEGDEAVSFVADFLASGDCELREEAALSLGTSRLTGAISTLQAAWEKAHETELRATILRALSASRQDAALDFLLATLRQARQRDALNALTALELHRENNELRSRIVEAIEIRGDELVRRRFLERFIAISDA
ncbi:MAG: hypothetical protein JO210_19310 [Acidobacteriaceae bacterium]|nr:hypothetical protein [Acidobacteriaceae bacterium]